MEPSKSTPPRAQAPNSSGPRLEKARDLPFLSLWTTLEMPFQPQDKQQRSIVKQSAVAPQRLFHSRISA